MRFCIFHRLSWRRRLDLRVTVACIRILKMRIYMACLFCTDLAFQKDGAPEQIAREISATADPYANDCNH